MSAACCPQTEVNRMPEARPNSLGQALRSFFGDYLTAVRGNSRHTVLSYRDAVKLLLRFLEQHLGRPAATLDFTDLTAEAVLAFLHHLEQHRANTVATRNNRLAALHAFSRYAAANYPEHLELCQQLLALPPKRARNGPSSISTGTRSERCCRHRTRQPRRAVGTVPCCWPCTTRERVCRKSSTCALATCSWSVPAKCGCSGRGARSASARCSPRRRPPCALQQEQGLLPGEERPLFRNRYGQPLGRHGVRYILGNHARTASQSAPSLAGRSVHPHVMRHSAACHLLQSGIDIVTISHYYGHDSMGYHGRSIGTISQCLGPGL